jgi:hypothetical protein
LRETAWFYVRRCRHEVHAGQAEILKALEAVEANSAMADERYARAGEYCAWVGEKFVNPLSLAPRPRRFNAILNAVNDLGSDMKLVKGLLASSRLGA